VKINSLTGFSKFNYTVKEKADGKSPGGNQHQQDQTDSQSQQSDGKNEFAEKMDYFGSEIEGDRTPGLKVNLKSEKPETAVRQISGEEFLKLREKLANSALIRRKKLDPRR
jgi:hypothetical protein